MRLHLTLKLPGRNGAPSQFLICEAPVDSLIDWKDLLNEDDHVIVTELNTDRTTGLLTEGDEVVLHHDIVGKSTAYRPRQVF